METVQELELPEETQVERELNLLMEMTLRLEHELEFAVRFQEQN